MKAIETRYKGYRFRSRLEARWAVFFDAIGARWEYEREAYDLGADVGCYLPDFFVYMSPTWERARITPGAGYWIEIKPVEPTSLERTKLAALAHLTNHHSYLMVGPPGNNWHWFASRYESDARGCRLAQNSYWPNCTIEEGLRYLTEIWAPQGLVEKFEFRSAVSRSRAARFGR
jgi:hypothetical protein